MPNRQPINTKAQAARERKKAFNDAKKAEQEKLIEDKKWEDKDKKTNALLERREEAQQKFDSKIQKRKELRTLEDEENKRLMNISKPKIKSDSVAVKKLTQAEINLRLLKFEREKIKAAEEEDTIEPNLNREFVYSKNEDDEDESEVQVTGLDSALQSLNIGTPQDVHPEKRMKAGHLAFTEKMLPILKDEHPNLRRSQLKQMIWNMWLKSPENPLNSSKA